MTAPMTREELLADYSNLPESVRAHLFELEIFIGDVDGKEVDDGTIDAADAVTAFNGIVATLQRIEAALQPFVTFASASAFKHFADDFVLTMGSQMAMRQLTAGDFRKLLIALAGVQP